MPYSVQMVVTDTCFTEIVQGSSAHNSVELVGSFVGISFVCI